MDRSISDQVGWTEFGKQVPRRHHAEVILDANDDEVLVVTRERPDGSKESHKYKLSEIAFPGLQLSSIDNLTGLDGQNIQLNRWNESLQGRAMKNDTDQNWETIETALNAVIANQKQFADWLNDFVAKINAADGGFKDWATATVLKALSDNFVDQKTYTKAVTSLIQQISNVRQPVKQTSNATGQYPGLIQDSQGGGN